MNTLKLDSHRLALAAQQEFRTRPYQEKTELAAVAGQFISQISEANVLSVRETLYAAFELFVLIPWQAGRDERLNGAVQLEIIYGLSAYIFNAQFDDGRLTGLVFINTDDLNIFRKLVTAASRANQFLWLQTTKLIGNIYLGTINSFRGIIKFPTVLYRSIIFPFFLAFQSLLRFFFYDSLFFLYSKAFAFLRFIYNTAHGLVYFIYSRAFAFLRFIYNTAHGLVYFIYKKVRDFFTFIYRSGTSFTSFLFYQSPIYIFNKLVMPFYFAFKSAANLSVLILVNTFQGTVSRILELLSFLDQLTKSFLRFFLFRFKKALSFTREKLFPQYGYKLAGIDTAAVFNNLKKLSLLRRINSELPPIWIKTTSGSLYENILLRVLSCFPELVVINLVNFTSEAYEGGLSIAQLGDVRLAEFKRLERFLVNKATPLIFLDCNVSSFAAHLLANESRLKANLIIPCLISGDVFSFGPVNPRITYLSYGRQGDRAIHAIAKATGVAEPKCLPIGAFFAAPDVASSSTIRPAAVLNRAKRSTVVFCLGGDFIEEEILALRQYNPRLHPHLDLIVRFHPNVELQKKYPRSVFESRAYRVSTSHGLNDLLFSEDSPLVVTGPSSSLVHALTGGFRVQLLAISGNPQEFDKIEVASHHHHLVATSLTDALNRIRYAGSDFDAQQIFLQSEYNFSDSRDPRFSYLSS